LASLAVTVYVPALRPETEAVVAPVLQTNDFVPVPPVALAVAEPFVAPLHPMFVPEILATTAVGCVTVAVAVAVQLFASVTVMVYVPAVSPVAILDAAPELQEYVYEVVPPDAKALAKPLLPPLHDVALAVADTDNAVG